MGGGGGRTNNGPKWANGPPLPVPGTGGGGVGRGLGARILPMDPSHHRASPMARIRAGSDSPAWRLALWRRIRHPATPARTRAASRKRRWQPTGPGLPSLVGRRIVRPGLTPPILNCGPTRLPSRPRCIAIAAGPPHARRRRRLGRRRRRPLAARRALGGRPRAVDGAVVRRQMMLGVRLQYQFLLAIQTNCKYFYSF